MSHKTKFFVTKFYVGGAVEKDWEIIQEFMNGITVTIQAIMKGQDLKKKTEIEENLKETFCLKTDQLAEKSKAQHN